MAMRFDGLTGLQGKFPDTDLVILENQLGSDFCHE
jgi:hypothetical protein